MNLANEWLFHTLTIKIDRQQLCISAILWAWKIPWILMQQSLKDDKISDSCLKLHHLSHMFQLFKVFDKTSQIRDSLFLDFFYWNIVDLQCCVNLCSAENWFSLYIYKYILHIYTYIFSYFSMMVYHRLFGILPSAL